MSFWDLSEGGAVESTETFEMGGGDLEPIPNNTGCIATIEEAKWDEFQDDRYISLKWRVVDPQAYANRVVYQKVKVFGTSNCKDPKATSDKAKKMLAAIDANAGGGLRKINGEPTDYDLMVSLAGKLMAIKLMVWEMEINGEERKGNWVAAVSPHKTNGSAAAKPQPTAQAPVIDDGSDSIPF